MDQIQVDNFNEGPVITGHLLSGGYVAFDPSREMIRGHGPTRWSAIADLNRAIEEAGEDHDGEDDDRPLTGQDAIEAAWDHARDHRKHEAL